MATDSNTFDFDNLDDDALLRIASAAAAAKRARGLKVTTEGKRLPDVGEVNRIATRAAAFAVGTPWAEGDAAYTAGHVGADYRPPVGDLRAAGFTPSDNPAHDGKPVTNVTADAIIAAAAAVGATVDFSGCDNPDTAAMAFAAGIGSDFHANYSATRPRKDRAAK